MHLRKTDGRLGGAQRSLDQVGDVGRRYLIVVLLKNVELAASFPHRPIGISRPAET